MINLRGIANSAIQNINPNSPMTVRISSGYSIDPLTLRQVPNYTEYPAMGNIQALDGDDKAQINYLNIQGTVRAVYLYGSLSGVIRPDNVSASSLVFSSNESGVTKSREWNVFQVLESWPGWCKVAVVYVEPAV